MIVGRPARTKMATPELAPTTEEPTLELSTRPAQAFPKKGCQRRRLGYSRSLLRTNRWPDSVSLVSWRQTLSASRPSSKWRLGRREVTLMVKTRRAVVAGPGLGSMPWTSKRARVVVDSDKLSEGVVE